MTWEVSKIVKKFNEQSVLIFGKDQPVMGN